MAYLDYRSNNVYFNNSSSGNKALWPLVGFLVSFISLGIYFSLTQGSLGFYAFSPVTATIPALLIALWIYRYSLKKQVPQFLQGVKSPSLLQMCFIFLLAGIFASLAKSSGSVDAIVNLSLNLLPSQWVVVGTFLITALIATSMGTSVGTIAAVAPIAFGLSEATTISPLLLASTVISGAMFGDNLSMISDTTIAATQTQGCHMRDKFIENITIAMPAALISIIVFFLLSPEIPTLKENPASIIHILPYSMIFILALLGIAAHWVLIIGIIAVSSIAFSTQSDYQLIDWVAQIVQGGQSMVDLIFLSLIIGGLGQLTEVNGGFNYIKTQLDHCFSKFTQQQSTRANKLKGEFGIGAIVSIINLATANNTIAILLAGSTAKLLAKNYGISAKRSASLLDIFACVIQGIIPWGAQLLFLASIFQLNPLQLSLVSLYPLILFIVTISFMAFKP